VSLIKTHSLVFELRFLQRLIDRQTTCGAVLHKFFLDPMLRSTGNLRPKSVVSALVTQSSFYARSNSAFFREKNKLQKCFFRRVYATHRQDVRGPCLVATYSLRTIGFGHKHDFFKFYSNKVCGNWQK